MPGFSPQSLSLSHFFLFSFCSCRSFDSYSFSSLTLLISTRVPLRVRSPCFCCRRGFTCRSSSFSQSVDLGVFIFSRMFQFIQKQTNSSIWPRQRRLVSANGAHAHPIKNSTGPINENRLTSNNIVWPMHTLCAVYSGSSVVWSDSLCWCSTVYILHFDHCQWKEKSNFGLLFAITSTNWIRSTFAVFGASPSIQPPPLPLLGLIGECPFVFPVVSAIVRVSVLPGACSWSL